jgi:hypothetical protein
MAFGPFFIVGLKAYFCGRFYQDNLISNINAKSKKNTFNDSRWMGNRKQNRL